ncbi:MAG TPA: VOC family protein [Acidimicrobiales bacterium]|nr:VOC family protein [Acidimicrobiales bacterium]
MEIYGIAYIGFESPNAKQMLEYGPEVFGFGLNESRDDGSVYLTMDDRDHRIAVHPGERDRFAYVGIETKDKWAWEQGIETLRSAGIEVTVGDDELEEQRGCYGVAQFLDPAGWPHELVYGHAYHSGGWHPGRAHRGFRSEEYGLGHTVLVADDVAEIERYCKDVMGYKWYIQGLRKGGGSFWRFRNSDLSHNIAYGLNPNHRRGDTATVIPHIGVYCRTLDDVGIAADIVEERYPERVEMTLGRHMQDPVVSFYSKTPAGFTIEYIWGEDLDVPDGPYVERRAGKLSLWGHKRPSGSAAH